MLSGTEYLVKVTCHQGGHELTNLFLRKIFRENLSFKVIELEDFFASNQVIKTISQTSSKRIIIYIKF